VNDYPNKNIFSRRFSRQIFVGHRFISALRQIIRRKHFSLLVKTFPTESNERKKQKRLPSLPEVYFIKKDVEIFFIFIDARTNAIQTISCIDFVLKFQIGQLISMKTFRSTIN